MFFYKRRLKKSSKGTKNIQKKKKEYFLRYCRKTWFFSQKIVKKIAEKKKDPFCSKFFDKKIFFFNFVFFTKDVLTTLLGGTKIITVIYTYFLCSKQNKNRYLPTHPIPFHPSHSSIRQYKLALAWDPGGMEKSGYIWKDYHISRKTEQISRKSRQLLEALAHNVQD